MSSTAKTMMSLKKKRGQKRKKACPAETQIYAHQLKFADVYVPTTISSKSYKYLPINRQKKNKRSRNTWVLLSDGGLLRSYALQFNKKAVPRITLGICSKREVDPLLAFQNQMLAHMVANRDAFWPEGISEEQVEEGMYKLIHPPRVNTKDKGPEKWEATLKALCALPKDGKAQYKLLDADGNRIIVEDLPRNQWDRMLIELGGVYFEGATNWGFSVKLRELRLKAEESDDEYDAERTELREKPPAEHDDNEEPTKEEKEEEQKSTKKQKRDPAGDEKAPDGNKKSKNDDDDDNDDGEGSETETYEKPEDEELMIGTQPPVDEFELEEEMAREAAKDAGEEVKEATTTAAGGPKEAEDPKAPEDPEDLEDAVPTTPSKRTRKGPTTRRRK